MAWFRADVDLPKNFSYEKVLFFTQLSHHLMCKLLKKSYMLSITQCLLLKNSKSLITEISIWSKLGFLWTYRLETGDDKVAWEMIWFAFPLGTARLSKKKSDLHQVMHLYFLPPSLSSYSFRFPSSKLEGSIFLLPPNTMWHVAYADHIIHNSRNVICNWLI